MEKWKKEGSEKNRGVDFWLFNFNGKIMLIVALAFKLSEGIPSIKWIKIK